MTVVQKIVANRRSDVKTLNILPGECAAVGDGTELVTVLGSCVAVCLSDLHSGVIGMNHFLLPSPGSKADSPLSASARYGTNAMEVLINQMMKLGACRRQLVARIYGGASILTANSSVGEGNIRFADSFLRTEGIPVVQRDVGGKSPRKIYFGGVGTHVRVECINSFTGLRDREVGTRRTLRRQLNRAQGNTAELFE